jgi:hypothetical protein
MSKAAYISPKIKFEANFDGRAKGLSPRTDTCRENIISSTWAAINNRGNVSCTGKRGSDISFSFDLIIEDNKPNNASRGGYKVDDIRRNVVKSCTI